MHEFLQEMRQAVFAGRPGDYLTVGEMPGVSVAEAALFTDPDRQELDMVFQFEHVSLDHGRHKFDVRPRRLEALKASLGRWQDGLGERGWNSLYWNNHDQPRAVSRFGNDDPATWRASATALAIVLHLHRGTPYIYQGEEIGMTSAPFESIADFSDVESVNYYRDARAAGRDPETILPGLRRMSRDNARTPVQWDGGAHAGFSVAEPWMPVNPNHVWLNASAQYDDGESVFAMYRRLIAFRHENPVIAHGSFTMLEHEHPQLYAYRRELDGTVVLVVANLSDESAAWTLPGGESLELEFSNLDDPDRGSLRPWEARVYGTPQSPSESPGRSGGQTRRSPASGG